MRFILIMKTINNKHNYTMKFSGTISFLIALILFLSGCMGGGSSQKDSQNEADTVTVADTGYTGIKQYMSGQYLIKEVTFENGVREGLMKSFYQDGRLRTTFWYENGLREDSARWYYQEGQLFRTTPYLRDTIHGIQKQYYRTGEVKAKIGFEKGFRTPYIEEFSRDGKLFRAYPDVIVNTVDEYKSRGLYKVTLSLSDKSTKVKFYRGEFTNGIFDTAHCIPINTVNGIGILGLKKNASTTSDYIGVIAEILTNYGNKYLAYKRIDLPYPDLN